MKKHTSSRQPKQVLVADIVSKGMAKRHQQGGVRHRIQAWRLKRGGKAYDKLRHQMLKQVGENGRMRATANQLHKYHRIQDRIFSLANLHEDEL